MTPYQKDNFFEKFQYQTGARDGPVGAGFRWVLSALQQGEKAAGQKVGGDSTMNKEASEYACYLIKQNIRCIKNGIRGEPSGNIPLGLS